jgi:hypothetical protein
MRLSIGSVERTHMNMHEKFAVSEMVSAARLRPQPSPWRGLCHRLATWVKYCADRYAAAAAYEELSRLSDAELRRRSLTRDVLARDL